MSFRDARLRSGKSVAQVMERFGISDAAVYQWETGVTMPKGSRLLELAEFYGVTVDEMLAPDGEEAKT